jgi:hypothetical protein
MSRAMTDEDVFTVGVEIEAMTSSGKAKAISCAVVMEDGNVRTWIRYLPNTKFPLLAGTTLLQHSLVAECAKPVTDD